MEFDAELHGENFHFSYINSCSVLVSGRNAEYILYKSNTWRCADEVPKRTVEELGEVIEEHVQRVPKRK